MRLRFHAASLAVAALACVLATSTAHAEPSRRDKASAQVHYRDGMKLYNLGRFAEAIREFERAYELDSAPVHLFNIAQSHKKHDNYPQARFFYRRYLAESPNAKNRSLVEERIAELDKLISAQQSPGQPLIPSRTSLSPPALTTSDARLTRDGRAEPLQTGTGTPAPAGAVETRPVPQHEESSWGAGRVAGLVLVGVGVAAIATGALLLRNAAQDCSAPAGAVCDQGPRSKVPGWGLVGAGAAAGIAGGVMFFVGRDVQDSMGPSPHAFILSVRGTL